MVSLEDYEPEENKMTLEVKMSRFDFGGTVRLPVDVETKSFPFTLGPWSGRAFLAESQQVSFKESKMFLEFSMELVPDKHHTIAQTLADFFGAEIVTNDGEPNV